MVSCLANCEADVRFFMTSDVPRIDGGPPACLQSSTPLLPSFAAKNSVPFTSVSEPGSEPMAEGRLGTACATGARKAKGEQELVMGRDLGGGHGMMDVLAVGFELECATTVEAGLTAMTENP